MNLTEFTRTVKNWNRYYKNQGIPLNKIEVCFTIHRPDSDELVPVEKETIEHGHYEARQEEMELVGGYRGKLYYISLRGFNDDAQAGVAKEKSELTENYDKECCIDK